MRAALEARRLGRRRRPASPPSGRHRKRLAPGVTTPEIDALIAAAVAAGAWSGKVCGAGGGGCLFALAPPESTAAVRAAWARAGARLLDAQVDPRGVVVEEQSRHAAAR